MLGGARTFLVTMLLASTATAAEGVTITFSTGATMTLPPGAQAVPPPQKAVAAGVSARLYRLGGALLTITEPKLDGQSCPAHLAADLQQMRQNAANDDPVFKSVFLIHKVERVTIESIPALYTEGEVRSAQEAAANKPYHSVLSYELCRQNTYIVVSLAAVDGPFTAGAQTTLQTVVKSFRLK